jgi:putative membrane protein
MSGPYNRTVHNVEHLTFEHRGAVVANRQSCGAVSSLASGFQVLYLLALSIGQIPVFAYVTFASTVLYPTYEVAPRIVPLTPLEDQQLGGILMHVAGMGVLFIALVVVFRQWYQSENVSHTHDALLHLP